MSKQKQNPQAQKKTAQTTTSKPGDGLNGYRTFLWLTVFATTLFVWPGALDISLAPRFLFLSLSLIVSIFLIFKDLRENGDFRFHAFDILFLVWYGWNLASFGWTSSWSEAAFFTQKVLLAFLTYRIFRQALFRGEGMVRAAMHKIVPLLTLVLTVVLLGQLFQAFSKVGLDNEQLYDFAKGLHGNKGLVSDLLFFLLIFNLLLLRDAPRKTFFIAGIAASLLLILVLQTRTVYLSVIAAALLYFPVRAAIEPGFRPIFLKKLLPAGVLAIGALAALMAFKGRGSSLAERLNPMTYLESASANERRFVWYKTGLLNAEHKLIGVGNGSWKIWFPSKSISGAYRMEEKGVIFTRAHNDYLEIQSELGNIGLAIFLLLFGLAAWAAVWGIRRLGDFGHRHDLLVLLAGLLGYCIVQYFDFPRERIEMQVILAVFFAWIAFLAAGFWRRLPGIQIQKAFPGIVVLALAGLVFNAVLGWQRTVAETHCVKMMEAQAKNDYRGMLREAELAQNGFNEFSDVALPISWYAGVAHFQMNQMDKAVESFADAYRLNPWSFQVINNYASALVKSGKIREALPLFEKTLTINPKYDEGKFNLAFSHYQLGEYQKALEYLHKVDTIVGAKTPDELEKNKVLNKKKAEFEAQIRSKM